MRWRISAAALAVVAAAGVTHAQNQTPVQTPTTSQAPATPSSAITVVGCMQEAVADGSLGGTPLGTSATPADAGVVANVQPRVEGYILTGARPAGRAEVGTSGSGAVDEPAKEAELKTYALEGKIAEFEAHKGQRVEVTGTLAPPVPSGRNPGSADTFKTGVERLRVQSIARVAGGCQDSR